MLDEIRPRLSPTAQVRRRSDGTEGIYDAASGHFFETAQDQAGLVELFDGQRTLLEISAECLNRHGFVPFGALHDLTRALAAADLLANSPDELDRLGLSDQGNWTDLLMPRELFRGKSRAPTFLRVLEVLACIAAGVYCSLLPVAPLSPADVGLFYVGAVIALTLRGRFKGTVCALLGAAPTRTRFSMTLGVFSWTPDHAIAVLLDRRGRILAYIAALAGEICALTIGHFHPGLWAGAFVVLVIDLCPFVASTFGRLLGTISGRVDLREHVRAYIGRPLVRNILAFRLPRSDRDLFFAALLSLGWIGAIAYTMFTRGLSTAVKLIDVGIAESGFRAAVAYGGACVLFVACPLLLLVLAGRVVEAAFSFLFASTTKRSGGAVDLSAFRAIPIFSKLGEGDLRAMAELSREVAYEGGQTIVEQGQHGDTFYSIRNGVVLVERVDEKSNRTRPIARLGAGDCFGEMALIQEGGTRTATVKAITDTVVIELKREAFEKIRASVEGLDFVAVLRAATAVGQSRLFRELPAERQSALAMRFVPRSVARGQDVVRHGDPGSEFYLIGRGVFEVLDASGKKVAQLGEGDHFGEIALLRNVARTATVRAATDGFVLALSRDVFLQAMSADLSLSARVEQIADTRAKEIAKPPASAVS